VVPQDETLYTYKNMNASFGTGDMSVQKDVHITKKHLFKLF
jgi:hypothetical protein